MEQTKPYHLMTPAERTALRIAQNREIDKNTAPVVRVLSNRQKRLERQKADRDLARVITRDLESMYNERMEAGDVAGAKLVLGGVRGAVLLFGAFRRVTRGAAGTF